MVEGRVSVRVSKPAPAACTLIAATGRIQSAKGKEMRAGKQLLGMSQEGQGTPRQGDTEDVRGRAAWSRYMQPFPLKMVSASYSHASRHDFLRLLARQARQAVELKCPDRNAQVALAGTQPASPFFEDKYRYYSYRETPPPSTADDTSLSC